MTKKHRTKCIFLGFLFTLAGKVEAKAPSRIQSVMIDRGKVTRIFIAPGLGSVLTLPCNIAEAFVGREAEVTVKVSPTSRHILLLSLNSGSSEPTNMVVRCERGRINLVFDIIPSRSLHQDIVEVRASYGSPEMKGDDLNLIDSSEKKAISNTDRDTGSEPKPRRVVIVEKPRPYLSEAKSSKPTKVN